MNNQSLSLCFVMDLEVGSMEVVAHLVMDWMTLVESKLKLPAVWVQCCDSLHFDERNLGDLFYERCFVADYFRLDLKPSLSIICTREHSIDQLKELSKATHSPTTNAAVRFLYISSFGSTMKDL